MAPNLRETLTMSTESLVLDDAQLLQDQIENAITPCRLWAINRQTFQAIMVRTGLAKHTQYINFLRSVPMFKERNEKELSRLVDVLEEQTYKFGEYIARQGGLCGTFYIVTKGELRVTAFAQPSMLKPQTQEKFIKTLTVGDSFGESALRNGEEIHQFNIVVASSSGATCVALDYVSYMKLLSGATEKERRPSISSEGTVAIRNEFINLQLTDFTVVATLGLGGFGRVELVRKNQEPDRTFAMKIMKKEHIVATKQEAHVLNERNIMMESESHFIVKLFKTWKDARLLYLLMEPCLGGEVWTLLRDKGYFDDQEARFYSACAMEALEYLHQQGIIYRDLKPENMLIDSTGYAKLVDFGFAKKVGIGKKTWTFCGTPEYVAPEVVLNKGHDYAVDLWSLDAMKTYNMILRGVDAIEWPRMISKNAITIIKRLCRDSPADRLGCGRGGMNEVRTMRWFEGFDFAALNKRSMPPPYVPTVASSSDVSNFDNFSPENDPEPSEDLSGWDENF